MFRISRLAAIVAMSLAAAPALALAQGLISIGPSGDFDTDAGEDLALVFFWDDIRPDQSLEFDTGEPEVSAGMGGPTVEGWGFIVLPELEGLQGELINRLGDGCGTGVLELGANSVEIVCPDELDVAGLIASSPYLLVMEHAEPFDNTDRFYQLSFVYTDPADVVYDGAQGDPNTGHNRNLNVFNTADGLAFGLTVFSAGEFSGGFSDWGLYLRGADWAALLINGDAVGDQEEGSAELWTFTDGWSYVPISTRLPGLRVVTIAETTDVTEAPTTTAAATTTRAATTTTTAAPAPDEPEPEDVVLVGESDGTPVTVWILGGGLLVAVVGGTLYWISRRRGETGCEVEYVAWQAAQQDRDEAWQGLRQAQMKADASRSARDQIQNDLEVAEAMRDRMRRFGDEASHDPNITTVEQAEARVGELEGRLAPAQQQVDADEVVEAAAQRTLDEATEREERTHRTYDECMGQASTTAAPAAPTQVAAGGAPAVTTGDPATTSGPTTTADAGTTGVISKPDDKPTRTRWIEHKAATEFRINTDGRVEVRIAQTGGFRKTIEQTLPMFHRWAARTDSYADDGSVTVPGDAVDAMPDHLTDYVDEAGLAVDFVIPLRVVTLRCERFEVDEGDGWVDTGQRRIKEVGEPRTVEHTTTWTSGGVRPRDPQQAYVIATRALLSARNAEERMAQYRSDCQ